MGNGLLTMEEDDFVRLGLILHAPYNNAAIAVGTGHMTRVDPAHRGNDLQGHEQRRRGKRVWS